MAIKSRRQLCGTETELTCCEIRRQRGGACSSKATRLETETDKAPENIQIGG